MTIGESGAPVHSSVTVHHFLGAGQFADPDSLFHRRTCQHSMSTLDIQGPCARVHGHLLSPHPKTLRLYTAERASPVEVALERNVLFLRWRKPHYAFGCPLCNTSLYVAATLEDTKLDAQCQRAWLYHRADYHGDTPPVRKPRQVAEPIAWLPQHAPAPVLERISSFQSFCHAHGLARLRLISDRVPADRLDALREAIAEDLAAGRPLPALREQRTVYAPFCVSFEVVVCDSDVPTDGSVERARRVGKRVAHTMLRAVVEELTPRGVNVEGLYALLVFNAVPTTVRPARDAEHDMNRTYALRVHVPEAVFHEDEAADVVRAWGRRSSQVNMVRDEGEWHRVETVIDPRRDVAEEAGANLGVFPWQVTSGFACRGAIDVVGTPCDRGGSCALHATLIYRDDRISSDESGRDASEARTIHEELQKDNLPLLRATKVCTPDASPAPPHPVRAQMVADVRARHATRGDPFVADTSCGKTGPGFFSEGQAQ
jgi:hypothetical protein